MPFHVQDCHEQAINPQELYDYSQRFGFKQWLHALEPKKQEVQGELRYYVVTEERIGLSGCSVCSKQK